MECTAPDYRFRPVGVVAVDKGTIRLESGPPLLQALIDELEVTASGCGEPVSPDDPDYALAVADSIGRQSAWRFTVDDIA